MKYAIVHAPVGPSVVLPFPKEGKEPKCEVLATDAEKDEFVSALTADDTVYCELGSVSDRLALACHLRSAKVLRVPLFRLDAEIEGESEASAGEEIARAEGAEMTGEESPFAEEDSKLLALRKQRAFAIYQASECDPGLFYPLIAKEVPVLILIVLWKAFHLMQRARIAAHLRLLSTYRDLHLVKAALGMRSASDKEALLTEMLGDKSLQGLSPADRKKYLAALEAGDVVFEAVTDREKELVKLITAHIEEIDLYEQVFKPIKGCGPLTAARMIGVISDFRRFPTLAAFRAYCGLHHFADGSRARRRKGHVSNWSQVGKQGAWQFARSVGYTPAGESVWRDLYDRRRAYELSKLLRGMDPAFVPSEYHGRTIASVLDLAVEDLDVFIAKIDGLRGVETVEIEVEGKKNEVPYRTHAQAKYASAPALYNRALVSYEEGFAAANAGVKKMLKGVKAKAMNKAQRYIGQRFLKHIFLTGREVMGIAEPAPKTSNAA